MSDNSIDTFRITPRVLIVDNNEGTAHRHQEFVTLWGYKAIVAHGNNILLLNDAKEKAKDNRCHLALIDMRLVDDSDDDDISGLDLVRQIKPTTSIVVSGHGTPHLAVNSIIEKGAANFFEKNDSPLILQSELDKEAYRICAFKRNLKIETVGLFQDLVHELFKSTSREYWDQLLCVFAQLFPNANSLQLERFAPQEKIVNLITLPHSVILKVYEDTLQAVMVKISLTSQIQQEIKYIRSVFGNDSTLLSRSVSFWDIGGVVYSNSSIRDINFRKI